MPAAQKKAFLFIVRTPPFGSMRGKDALDTVLVTAAYGQQVRVLFLADGVFQLFVGQQPQAIHGVGYASGWAALPLYDVEHVYVSRQCLEQRKLSVNQLALSPQQVERNGIEALMAEQNVIFNC